MNKENIIITNTQRYKDAKPSKNYASLHPSFFASKAAFSLAEIMVLLLLISIFLAAMMPIISKRTKPRTVLGTISPTSGQVMYLYGSGDSTLTSTRYWSCTQTQYTEMGSLNNLYHKITSGGIYINEGGGICKNFISTGGQRNCFPAYVNNCPTGWTSAGVGITGNDTLVRPCYNTSQSCAVLYIYGNNLGDPDGSYENIFTTDGTNVHYGGSVYKNLSGMEGFATYPKACPTGWSDAGVGINSDGVSEAVLIRSCYKCG